MNFRTVALAPALLALGLIAVVPALAGSGKNGGDEPRYGGNDKYGRDGRDGRDGAVITIFKRGQGGGGGGHLYRGKTCHVGHATIKVMTYRDCYVMGGHIGKGGLSGQFTHHKMGGHGQGHGGYDYSGSFEHRDGNTLGSGAIKRHMLVSRGAAMQHKRRMKKAAVGVYGGYGFDGGYAYGGAHGYSDDAVVMLRKKRKLRRYQVLTD
jgi:hypothetical protein